MLSWSFILGLQNFCRVILHFRFNISSTNCRSHHHFRLWTYSLENQHNLHGNLQSIISRFVASFKEKARSVPILPTSCSMICASSSTSPLNFPWCQPIPTTCFLYGKKQLNHRLIKTCCWLRFGTNKDQNKSNKHLILTKMNRGQVKSMDSRQKIHGVYRVPLNCHFLR